MKENFSLFEEKIKTVEVIIADYYSDPGREKKY